MHSFNLVKRIVKQDVLNNTQPMQEISYKKYQKKLHLEPELKCLKLVWKSDQPKLEKPKTQSKPTF